MYSPADGDWSKSPRPTFLSLDGDLESGSARQWLETAAGRQDDKETHMGNLESVQAVYEAFGRGDVPGEPVLPLRRPPRRRAGLWSLTRCVIVDGPDGSLLECLHAV